MHDINTYSILCHQHAFRSIDQKDIQLVGLEPLEWRCNLPFKDLGGHSVKALVVDLHIISARFKSIQLISRQVTSLGYECQRLQNEKRSIYHTIPQTSHPPYLSIKLLCLCHILKRFTNGSFRSTCTTIGIRVTDSPRTTQQEALPFAKLEAVSIIDTPALSASRNAWAWRGSPGVIRYAPKPMRETWRPSFGMTAVEEGVALVAKCRQAIRGKTILV